LPCKTIDKKYLFVDIIIQIVDIIIQNIIKFGCFNNYAVYAIFQYEI